MTFFANPNAILRNPIFGEVTDYDPSLALLFRARDLIGFDDGDLVSAFTAGGTGEARLRLFDRADPAWSFPLYDDAPRPSLRFNGGQHITNFAAVSTYPAVPQPATVFARFQTDGFAYSSFGYARILGGGTTTANSWAIRPTNVPGQFYVGIGATNVLVNSALAPGEWGVIGVCFNGAESLIITPDATVIGAVLQEIPLNGIRMGGNANPGVTGTQGFIGNLNHARVYARAISEADLVHMHAAIEAA